MNVKRWLSTGLTGALVLTLLAGVGLIGLGGQPVQAQGGGQPYLGIRFENTANGARIADVMAASPAEAAGVQPGDLITAINGESLSETHTLVDVIDALAPGDVISLSVDRAGDALELEATLGVRPDNFDSMAATPVAPQAGQTGSEVRRQFFSFGGAVFARLAEGWRVDSVEANSAAAEAGLQPGDLVKTFDGTPTPDVRLGALVQLGGQGGAAALTVERDGETLDLSLTLAEGAPVEAYEAAESRPEADNTESGETAPALPPSVMTAGEARGYLGVSFITLTPEVLENLVEDEVILAVDEGALLVVVEPGTPAADAGLQVDDVITAVNAEPVDQERTLADRIYAYEAGDTITLSVARGEETLSLDITLAARPRELDVPNIQVLPIQPRPNDGDSSHPGLMLPFGMFLMDPDFDAQAYLDAHPELQALLGDLDLDALNQALSDLRQGMQDVPRGETFDWEQFLQAHPIFNDLLSRLHDSFNPDELEQMFPNFPWFGQYDPFHQNVDPLQPQENNDPA